MDIRRITPEDAEAYRALRIRGLWEYPEAFTSSSSEEEKRSVEEMALRLAKSNTMFWGYFDNGQLGGMVGLEREARAKSRHKAKVVGMYVAQEHAGFGVGHALFRALIEEARHEGIELLVLTVTHGNDQATRLYENLGFKSFGIEPKAIKVEGRYYGKNHMFLDLKAP